MSEVRGSATLRSDSSYGNDKRPGGSGMSRVATHPGHGVTDQTARVSALSPLRVLSCGAGHLTVGWCWCWCWVLAAWWARERDWKKENLVELVLADTRTARSFTMDSTTSSRRCGRAISNACVVATAARRGRRARGSGGNVTFGVVLETVFLRARGACTRRCAPLTSVTRKVHGGACVVPRGAILRAGRALFQELGDFSSHGVHETHWHKGSAARGGTQEVHVLRMQTFSAG